jgi:hypothetical protein
LVEKPEGKRPFGRPICRWENNIKMDPREVGLEGVDWILLTQDRDQWHALVNTVNDCNWNSHRNCIKVPTMSLNCH